MEKNNWIKTEKMLENLEKDPNNEHEYRILLGGCLFSTHWFVYDSNKQRFMESTDWGHYDSYTKKELQETLGNCWWHRDA